MQEEKDTVNPIKRILESENFRLIIGIILAAALIVTATVPTILAEKSIEKEENQLSTEPSTVKVVQEKVVLEADAAIEAFNVLQTRIALRNTSGTTTTITTTTTTTQTTTTTASEMTTTTTVATASAVAPEEPDDEGETAEYEETYEESYDESYDESYEDTYVDTYSSAVSDSDYILLCNAVANEAGSNWIATSEKAKVCEVILNRVYSDAYPGTIYGVLTQPYQFSGCWGYVDLGSFSDYVTEDVKSAVSGYLDGTYGNHGYYSFRGDGYQNYFS
ncbi:MAG: cell wall hydrolase [Clostridia bacterium]|nr:cell wall hydrolase [Clostridia bacterium]MBR4260791.1 cell wall hydrolase [Clostridia bacterium]